MKFGIVRFPGSCDEVDAAAACDRVGEAEILWHRDADLRGVDAVVVPGGFSYGDYLRVGSIARFAPAIPDDVVAATRERYVTAYETLSGEPFSAWLERTAP